jgi:hypothetical protein
MEAPHMIAFTDIKAEMRRSCAEIGHPTVTSDRPPVRLSREDIEGRDENSPVEPWMEAAFYGLIHAAETDEPYALVPCTMNGEPAVLLALMREKGNSTHVLPLFMAVQPWMKFGPAPGETEVIG